MSFETIRKQGYFNAQFVERLKARYTSPGFNINLPYETDILSIVLTFGIFLNIFKNIKAMKQRLVIIGGMASQAGALFLRR